MTKLVVDERPVTDVPAATPAEAVAHFSGLLAFETDGRDVHTAMEANHPGFVVLDVGGPDSGSVGLDAGSS